MYIYICWYKYIYILVFSYFIDYEKETSVKYFRTFFNTTIIIIVIRNICDIKFKIKIKSIIEFLNISFYLKKNIQRATWNTFAGPARGPWVTGLVTTGLNYPRP